ncbi:MAG: DUF362 domain-containing protein [Euryarchaeota archaeon]|nr:DUF362 domain-containing protein [Euryarchaeota archaeon]
MTDVSLVRCEEYGRENAYGAVTRAIDLIGGVGRFVRPGERVLVKPNILHPSSPDKAVCTHPDIIHAVCRLLREHGCEVLIADSPGAGSVYGPSQMEKAYETTGYGQVARDLGVELNVDVSSLMVQNPGGMLIKMFPLIKPATQVDAIVIVSKLKTHSLTYMTAGTKNAFGLVAGMEKATFHGRLPDPDDFARMLVDLNELVRPRLEIIDAVLAMEGGGPYSGSPRKIGAVLASDSYAAIDVVAAKLIGIEPMDVPTIRAAVERGVLKSGLEDVVVKGDGLEGLAVKDFKGPPTYDEGGMKGLNVLVKKATALAKAYALRPEIIKRNCTGCGRCERSCPMNVIKMRKGVARIMYRRCIRCYTCHEMCTSAAIELKRGLGGRMAVMIFERRNRVEGAR